MHLRRWKKVQRALSYPYELKNGPPFVRYGGNQQGVQAEETLRYRAVSHKNRK